MLERVDGKSFWLLCPYSPNVFVRRETLQGLEPSGEVVGHQEAVRMRFELGVRGVVVPVDGCFLQRAVHAFDLSIRPRVFWFREPVFDPMLVAALIKHMGDPLRRWPVAVTQRMTELAAVIGQKCMDLVRNNPDEAAQEHRGNGSVGCMVQLRIGELAGAVDGDEQIEFAFFRVHFGDVEMEVSNGIFLKRLPRGFLGLDIRQAADAMALIATMQGRAR